MRDYLASFLMGGGLVLLLVTVLAIALLVLETA